MPPTAAATAAAAASGAGAAAVLAKLHNVLQEERGRRKNIHEHIKRHVEAETGI